MTEPAASLAPGYLIASPKLDGSLFERAVIMMVHHDEEGAMGFIVNKPLDMDVGGLFASMDSAILDQIDPRCARVDVHFGGPVRMEQLWVLLCEDSAEGLTFDEDGTIVFGERWCVLAAAEDIERVMRGEHGAVCWPCLGYSGWGAGQLEEELADGSWLFLDFDEALVLDEAEDEQWSRALELLGVAPMAFMMMSGLAQA